MQNEEFRARSKADSTELPGLEKCRKRPKEEKGKAQNLNDILYNLRGKWWGCSFYFRNSFPKTSAAFPEE